MRNRPGSGVPYLPHLSGLGQDDFLDDDFSSEGTPDLSTVDLTSDADFSESSPDLTSLAASAPVYDETSGQLLDSSGNPIGAATGILSAVGGIGSALARVFGGGSAAQINASGVSAEDGTESPLMMLLIVGAAAGVLYMVFSDRS